jgi:hypothetical protein
MIPSRCMTEQVDVQRSGRIRYRRRIRPIAAVARTLSVVRSMKAWLCGKLAAAAGGVAAVAEQRADPGLVYGECSKRPASLWIEDEAVPLGAVVAVVLAESLDHHARN